MNNHTQSVYQRQSHTAFQRRDKGKRPAEQQASFQFLSLPADLRLEIYHHLLGGRTLHFNDYFRELGNAGLFLCRASISDEIFFGKDQKHTVFKLKAGEDDMCLSNRHRWCYTDWEGLQLQFLLVCKQVYLEACAVPFKANVFSFPSREMVARLRARLDPWQASYIRSVKLYHQGPWRYWHRPLGDLSDPHRRALRPKLFINLRYIQVFLEGFVAGDVPIINANEKHYMDALVAAMADLRSPKLSPENVEVTLVDAIDAYTPTACPRFTAGQLEAWAVRMRSMFAQHSAAT